MSLSVKSNPDKLENIKVLRTLFSTPLRGTLFSPPLRGISTLTVEADSEQRETFEFFISKEFLNFLLFFSRDKHPKQPGINSDFETNSKVLTVRNVNEYCC